MAPLAPPSSTLARRVVTLDATTLLGLGPEELVTFKASSTVRPPSPPPEIVLAPFTGRGFHELVSRLSGPTNRGAGDRNLNQSVSHGSRPSGAVDPDRA